LTLRLEKSLRNAAGVAPDPQLPYELQGLNGTFLVVGGGDGYRVTSGAERSGASDGRQLARHGS
jgi:hypothetical protein